MMEVDEAELRAARIVEWRGGAGAQRRRSASASSAARARLLLLRSERQGGGEVKWRSGVACARSDCFEGGARLVGAGTAPRRRCTGVAWRLGRRGRRARLHAGAAAAWAWAGEALLARAKRAVGGDAGQAGFGRGPGS